MTTTVLVVWLVTLTLVNIGGFVILFRLCGVLTGDVERVESLCEKVKHQFVRSTLLEDAGRTERREFAERTGAFKRIKTRGARRG